MAGKLSAEQVASEAAGLTGWHADGDAALSRTFVFRDHGEAMGFVVRVALAAEAMNHHPDLRIIHSRVEIRLSSHDAGGVTERDLELARRISAFV